MLFQPNIRGGIIRGSFLKHDQSFGKGGGGNDLKAFRKNMKKDVDRDIVGFKNFYVNV